MYHLHLLFFVFTSMAIAYNSIGRQKSLRIGNPPILLNNFHSMITQKAAKPSSFKSLLSYADNNDSLFVSPLFGLGYRLLKDDSVINSDIGFLVKGNQDIISFYLDSRIYMESHTHSEIQVWDGEMVESQNSNSGDDANLTYISYARFRGGMKADTKMGVFGFKRDPLHWGPGRNSGLMFSEHSIPFNHFYYTGTIGPLSVQSIYSKLAIDGNGNGRWIHSDRNLFAHRYTLNVNENLILGISEQLIMFEQDDFAAVVPIVPLFMLKGSGVEDNNNGSISFDISYKFSEIADIYSEFLIDDISEPTKLFNDFWKNKWGYLGGIHLASSRDGIDLGVIVEYIRIEPWGLYSLYSKFCPSYTSRAAIGALFWSKFSKNLV